VKHGAFIFQPDVDVATHIHVQEDGPKRRFDIYFTFPISFSFFPSFDAVNVDIVASVLLWIN